MPKISVIVPVYKAEKYLDCCVSSILNQTVQDIELILVDDESPDNCPAMCDVYSTNDSRVKAIHIANGGAGHARNAGIKAAQGDYIGFVDSDDWIEPDMYACLLGLIEQYNADMSICDVYNSNVNHGDVPQRGTPTVNVWNKKQGLDAFFRVDGGDGFNSIWRRLVRRELCNDWSFIEGKMNEDVHASYCMTAFVNKTVYTNRKLYHYRKNMEGVTNCHFTIKKMDLIEVWNMVAEMVEIYTPEYQYACEMNRKRAYMTLLVRMFVDGYDRHNEELCELHKELKRQIRSSYFQLLHWKMPMSRKILMTALMF